ncbi:MAG TPA: tRNA (adenosine(37)-N6)-dimethylallyltransferase MiaA [Sedimentisphaerales bacterium]|nr:tRNA (adenosine(37)-N6)-dimethylallyltransferase MiaA [Sedimentisphaerales bacterium]
MANSKQKKILILGVTASGKGRVAFDLAQDLDAEIVSIDSMKVYRRMDIGTAKPPKEVRERVNYHVIDVVEPSESFNVAAFLDAASGAIRQIENRGKNIIAVGGTALYVKSLLYGLFEEAGTDEQLRARLHARAEAEGPAELHRELTQIDPAAADRINPNDTRRIVRALEVYQTTGRPISSLQKQWQTQELKHDWTIIGLRREKADAAGRINKRVRRMMAAGLVDEAKALLKEEKPLSQQARCAIGYAEIIEYLNGRMDLDETTELIKKNTRRLAKSQRTWFKTFQDVHWIDVEPDEPGEKTFERARTLLDDVLA